MGDLDREARARARIGATLKDKWRLEELLGVGGVAAVYAARHKNGKRVAIKVLHPLFADDERVVTRFSREGYVANRILHPGVVGIDDDDVDPDHGPFLVMELCEGETLEAWRRRRGGRVSAAELEPVLAKLLRVLGAAHEKGVVHRDLKPDNVMLTTSGEVKILDFGLARAREVWTREGALTEPEALLGTPGFMAPEQAMGRWERVDDKTDLWAVGATAFALLTGRSVHVGDSVQGLLVTAATEPAPPIRKVCPEIPDGLAALVDRALAFSKAERFASAKEMEAALAGRAAPVRSLPPRAKTARASSPPPRGARMLGPRWTWFAAAALLGVAGYVALSAARRAEDADPARGAGAVGAVGGPPASTPVSDATGDGHPPADSDAVHAVPADMSPEETPIASSAPAVGPAMGAPPIEAGAPSAGPSAAVDSPSALDRRK